MKRLELIKNRKFDNWSMCNIFLIRNLNRIFMLIFLFQCHLLHQVDFHILPSPVPASAQLDWVSLIVTFLPTSTSTTQTPSGIVYFTANLYFILTKLGCLTQWNLPKLRLAQLCPSLFLLLSILTFVRILLQRFKQHQRYAFIRE